jgi:hypothetical protein
MGPTSDTCGRTLQRCCIRIHHSRSVLVRVRDHYPLLRPAHQSVVEPKVERLAQPATSLLDLKGLREVRVATLRVLRHVSRAHLSGPKLEASLATGPVQLRMLVKLTAKLYRQ